MTYIGEEGMHQQLEEQEQVPHQQEMHPVQQEIHPIQQEMHPVQMYPVKIVLSIVWQSKYGINYFTLQTLWTL